MNSNEPACVTWVLQEGMVSQSNEEATAFVTSNKVSGFISTIGGDNACSNAAYGQDNVKQGIWRAWMSSVSPEDNVYDRFYNRNERDLVLPNGEKIGYIRFDDPVPANNGIFFNVPGPWINVTQDGDELLLPDDPHFDPYDQKVWTNTDSSGHWLFSNGSCGGSWSLYGYQYPDFTMGVVGSPYSTDYSWTWNDSMMVPDCLHDYPNPANQAQERLYCIYDTPAVNPPTCNLTANPAVITLGESTTLSWTTTDATDGVINPGGINAIPIGSGSTTVTPQTSTSYILTVNGPGGSVTCSTYVTVNLPTTPYCTLTAVPDTIVPGQSSILNWVTYNYPSATDAHIDPGNIPATPIPAGSTTVNPTVTTDYTMTVNGPSGEISCDATVNVTLANVFVTSMNFTAMLQGEAFILGCDNYGMQYPLITCVDPLSSADWLCQHLADNSSMVKHGNWRPWLSTDNNDSPIEAIERFTVTTQRNLIDTTGDTIGTFAGIGIGAGITLQSNKYINHDENGNIIEDDPMNWENTHIWTATRPNGRIWWAYLSWPDDYTTCGNWGGGTNGNYGYIYGDSDDSDHNTWSSIDDWYYCGDPYYAPEYALRLYCVYDGI